MYRRNDINTIKMLCVSLNFKEVKKESEFFFCFSLPGSSTGLEKAVKIQKREKEKERESKGGGGRGDVGEEGGKSMDERSH